MKRRIVCFFIIVFSLFGLVACNRAKEEGNVTLYCTIERIQETRVVISVTETDGKSTLLDCMKQLAAGTETFSYQEAGGMVTEINGKSNAADFSACWMLYTSDARMSNTEWGTVEYDSKTLGSAIVGAAFLTVKSGEIYIWEYANF